MSKYIIKNCPALDKQYNECHSKIGPHRIYCIYCTDCVIKQIVEECKNMKHNSLNIILRVFADSILQRLDIQEVE